MTPAKYSFVAPPRIFFLILFFLLLPISQVNAAIITVSGACSLPDAITAANTDTDTGGSNSEL